MTTAFDRFVSLLNYPVYIVTAAVGEELAGCLVGFASQCSLDPPRFAVWISKANHTYTVVERTDVLVVHLLPKEHALAELFGGETGDRADKFAEVPWTPGPAGAPVLGQALAWFAGRVEQRADWGDHVGYSLTPFEGGTHTGGQPLSYRDVADVQAGHPA